MLLSYASYPILSRLYCKINRINSLMKQQIAQYEDVVAGEKNDREQNYEANKHNSNAKKSPDVPEEGSGKEGGGDKDENPHAKLEQRAEKLAEDPYMTQAEMQHMDGDTKEKEQKVDNEDKGKEQEETKQTEKDLDILASRADKILFKAKGLFPFDFFPNTITIDANKVNIIISTFFLTETVTSILLKEIMDVRVETTLFLGKLIIDYGPHPLKVTTVYVPSLWKKDALKAKEIIEGILVIYRSENIDTTKLKPEETLDEVKDIGKIEERET
jgi:hypothetical protein